MADALRHRSRPPGAVHQRFQAPVEAVQGSGSSARRPSHCVRWQGTPRPSGTASGCATTTTTTIIISLAVRCRGRRRPADASLPAYRELTPMCVTRFFVVSPLPPRMDCVARACNWLRSAIDPRKARRPARGAEQEVGFRGHRGRARAGARVLRVC